MVLKKSGLFGHHVLLRARIWHVVHGNRRREPRWKIRLELPKLHRFVCGVFERRVKSRVGIQPCNVPVRDHQASGARHESEPVVSRLGSFFARWRKKARIRSNCARKMAKPDVANPSVASLDIYGSAMSPSGNTSPRLFGPIVSPCGSTRSREQNASPNPGFLASGPPHSLVETRKKPPSLHPKKSPTPTVPTRR